MFPNGWEEISANVKKWRDDLFGKRPPVPAFDISDLVVPPEILQRIHEKNRSRIRDEVSIKEMVAEDSPFRIDTFIDDQLLEVITSMQHRYSAEDFIQQLVYLIRKFLNESAAFRTGMIQQRIMRENADKCVSVIKDAHSSAQDTDERAVLELLLMDLTYGGQEPWVAFLGPDSRRFVDWIVARQTG